MSPWSSIVTYCLWRLELENCHKIKPPPPKKKQLKIEIHKSYLNLLYHKVLNSNEAWTPQKLCYFLVSWNSWWQMKVKILVIIVFRHYSTDSALKDWKHLIFCMEMVCIWYTSLSPHIAEFWKMVIPIIWCYRQLQSPNSTLRYTIFNIH